MGKNVYPVVHQFPKRTSLPGRMRHSSDQLRFSASVWKPGFFVALVLFIVTVAAAQETHLRKVTVKPLPLPGANGLVMLDYFAYDNTSQRLWVPAANTGSVDVIDTTTDQVKPVEGFSVPQIQLRGKLRSVGPSSVAIGDGVVYIGSRADSKICIINDHTLKLGDCIAFAPASAGMAAAPDGLSTLPPRASCGPPVGLRRSASLLLTALSRSFPPLPL
jgi:hypothetical protein